MCERKCKFEENVIQINDAITTKLMCRKQVSEKDFISNAAKCSWKIGNI